MLLLANNKLQHGLTVRLISSLKFASGESKRKNDSHSRKQDSSREYHSSSSTAGEERGAHSPYRISVTCSVLGEEELLKLSSTIHKFMPAELFLLEENQITHTFWKLLMTVSQLLQAGSQWWFVFSYTSHTLRNLHLSGPDRVSPSSIFLGKILCLQTLSK